jgi:hypothetical protein
MQDADRKGLKIVDAASDRFSGDYRAQNLACKIIYS